MSYDKFRYLKEKKERKERKAQKVAGLKQVQISARAALNDLLVKTRQMEKFLNAGHPVEIRIRLRGRERNNKEWAFEKLNEFLKLCTVEYKVLMEPKIGGFGIMLQIGKK